ncbi:MAG: hypothetical protein SVK54_00375 [candidate division WOR-3 bacterium]|nr:hypothetical protein [candidate division WOR-3 bacterium]
MKRIVLIAVFTVLTITGCMPKHDLIEPDIDSIDISRSLNRAYEYSMSIVTPMYNLRVEGRKDALSRILIRGHMTMGNNKVSYNDFYTGREWIDYSTGKPIAHDPPINPHQFLKTALTEIEPEFIDWSGGNPVYEAQINTVLISPVNYLQKGKIIINSRDNSLRSVHISNESLTMDVKLNYPNDIYFSRRSEPKARIMLDMRETDMSALSRRMETSGRGYMEKETAYFFETDRTNRLLLEAERAYIASFIYSDPHGSADVYMDADERNPVEINDTLYTFTGSEDIIIEEKSNMYDIIINDIDIKKGDASLCLFTDSTCFRAVYDSRASILRIKNVTGKFIGVIYSIMLYPYN